MKMKKGLIVLVAAAALALIVALTCTATVQTGYTGQLLKLFLIFSFS